MGYLYQREKDFIYDKLCKILTAESTSDELFCQATTALCLLLDMEVCDNHLSGSQSQHGKLGGQALASQLQSTENSTD